MYRTTRLLVGVVVAALCGFVAVSAQDGAASHRARPLMAGTQAGGAVPRVQVAPPPASSASFVPDLSGAAVPLAANGVHPIVGSWFGKAVQVCPQGVAPSACGNGLPAIVLYMTPTLTPDGLFVADDSLTLLGPPFGPHTTAHGSWIATSSTGFIADYVFMNNPFPPERTAHIAGLRARWVGQMVDANTAVGWVNAYFLDATPATWVSLGTDEFPVLPTEASAFVTARNRFITDPTECPGQGCPKVFKFTIKRVTQ